VGSTLFTMTVTNLVSSTDAEIARLLEARNLLAADVSTSTSKAATKKTTGKRVMSAAGRKRIADAQRKRWAKQKKAKK
jgi:hypothetical protein